MRVFYTFFLFLFHMGNERPPVMLVESAGAAELNRVRCIVGNMGIGSSANRLYFKDGCTYNYVAC